MHADTIAATIQELASMTAASLARASINNTEVREAIVTQQTEHGVRIGNHFIIAEMNSDGDRRYRVENEAREIEYDELAFYDVARKLVFCLNSPRVACYHREMRALVALNGEFVRAMSDHNFLSARLETYERRYDDFRAMLTSNKLSEVATRADELRFKLDSFSVS